MNVEKMFRIVKTPTPAQQKVLNEFLWRHGMTLKEIRRQYDGIFTRKAFMACRDNGWITKSSSDGEWKGRATIDGYTISSKGRLAMKKTDWKEMKAVLKQMEDDAVLLAEQCGIMDWKE